MQKIRKAIIPVAGYGTRFLPATKAQPKEMLPVVDKPTVQYIVEACANAGITDIIIVTSGNKRAIEDHFDRTPELEKWLTKAKKPDLVKELRDIPRLANFIYIRQKGGYGNGTPVMNAEPLIGDEPFAVFWGDEFFYNKNSKKNWVKNMVEAYDKYQDPILSVIEVTAEETKRYGMVEGKEMEKNIFQISRIMEKPGPEKTNSRLGVIGGYILTPEIFKILKKTKPGKGGELWLTDAIAELLKTRSMYAFKSEDKLYDAGTIMGWLKANVELAMNHPKLGDEFKDYLKKLKLK